VADPASNWRTLADMDLEFGRSRRRAELRRKRNPRPRKTVPIGWRAVLLGVLLFGGAGVIGSSGGFNVSAGASRTAKAPSVDPRCPIPARFRNDFARAALDTRIPLSLLVAVAEQESRWDPSARSHAGAQGLLQLMPATAKELRLDPNVPSSNILAGARYLRRMFDRFGQTDLALAAYNAGPSAVERSGGAPGAETLTYVQNVKASWTRLAVCG
jgi:hypothetical protein